MIALVRIAAFVLLIAATLNTASAQNSDRNRSSGQPGRFDFYVLALSWSPSFCQDTEERGRDGKTVTGRTERFGNGTVTRWSDGTRTTTRPFGSGTITEERGRDGKTVTGRTQSFGSGTITRRSDGSSSRTQPFGSGTLQRDQPGRKVGR